MSNRAYLGLDTSFYTTSVAAVDEAGNLLVDLRSPIPVAAGARGVAPSTGVFHHVREVPPLLEQATASLRAQGFTVAGVGASVAPRPQPDSYLPVFKVSEGHGRALAAALGVPFVPTTHQEMHVMAGLWSAETAGYTPPQGERFLAVHLSGGTTELLLVRRRGAGGFDEEVLGGTKDLHGGQFVDRVGVSLGLPFPAGPHLERLAAGGEPTVRLPAAVQGRHVSFSGPCSQALRLVGQVPAADLALAVQACVAKTLEKWLRPAMVETGLRELLIVGGVAANGWIRERLVARLEHPAVGARLSFAQARFSVDNAVGVAEIARRELQHQEG
jgi:N6-L-threonylcarbamoyladenine synthase